MLQKTIYGRSLALLLLLLLLGTATTSFAETRRSGQEVVDAWEAKWKGTENWDWNDSYPLPEPSDGKIDVLVALRLAVEHILDNYEFTVDEAIAFTPMISFPGNHWQFDIVLPGEETILSYEAFEICIDGESGEVISERFGTPNG